MKENLGIYHFLAGTFIALILGVLIGIERQWRHRTAGMRTTALVSLGSAIFTSLSFIIDGSPSEMARIAAQVISGVGFLGGGIIMKDGFAVRGINTAATIWCTAGVGALCGLGFYTYGTIAAVMVLLSNIFLRPLAYRLDAVHPSPDSDDELDQDEKI
jgi:putative Mg2+ transporter-C (MgtC) family protein